MKNPFLHIVVDDLIRRMGLSGLENCTMVFPMQRAGLFVKQHLSQSLHESDKDEPVVLPRFTTIDSLADSLCELQPDEEIESVCSLYEIYKKQTGHSLPIDAFYGWGLQLLSDFSSADMALVDVKKLMEYTAEAAKLEKLELEDDVRERLEKLLHGDSVNDSIRKFYEDLWESLPKIQDEFHQQQMAKRVGTRGERTRWVIEHFNDESIRRQIQGRTFVFVGFNYLLPAERKLMELLKDTNQVLFYWDEIKEFKVDEEVYKFMHDNIIRFENSLPAEAIQMPYNKAEVTAVACQSSTGQAQYVHQWLKDHHHTGDKTAIVVADESMLQAVAYALPECDETISRINITKGYPLCQTRLYLDVLSLLDKATETTSLTVMDMLPKVMADLQTVYSGMERSSDDSWKMVLLDESYYQIQAVLRQMQNMLQKNNFVRSQITETKVLRNLVRRKLEMVNIPFHGEPVTDIQIIGVLETRLLDFDNILILNVEEGVVPTKANDRSFLPYDLRRAYGMVTREEESRIYAYNFFRLFRRAKNVTMTFSDSFTEQGKRSMSRFLMQILCSNEFHVSKYRLTESAITEPYALDQTIFQTDDCFPTHLSPSAISEYIECPRWFYLDKIKHITPSDIDSVLLPVNVIGSLVHGTLEYVYRSICGWKEGAHQPVEITKQQIEDYLKPTDSLSKALDEAYAKVNEEFNRYHSNEQNPYIREMHEAENFAILEMVNKVLKKDKDMTPFTLVWLEQELRMELGGVRLKGFVDRLDIVQHDGKQYLRILDYKTGSYDKKKVEFDWDSLVTDPDKRYALQTLIYCEMLSKNRPTQVDSSLPLRPELLYPRNASTQGDLLLKNTKDSTPVKDYQNECAESFVPALTELLHAIKTNCEEGKEFAPCEEKTCKNSYCPFHLLCGREKSSFAF